MKRLFEFYYNITESHPGWWYHPLKGKIFVLMNKAFWMGALVGNVVGVVIMAIIAS